MNQFEKAFLFKNAPQNQFSLVAGCDEAGRGAWAGPICVATVVFNKNYYNPLIKDSKMLSSAQRAKLYQVIKQEAVAIKVGVYNASYVDLFNPKQTSVRGMKTTVDLVAQKGMVVFSDAERFITSIPVFALIKGDTLSQSVAAASIVAKVTRDDIMLHYHLLYPHYGFDTHKGYGTALHYANLQKYNVCSIHRKSYRPIKKLLSHQPDFFK